MLAGCGRFGFDASPGSSDGAPQPDPDGEPPVLAVGCDVAHPTALICEGFEPVDVAWDYTVIEQGSAVRSTTRAANGVAALEVSTFEVEAFKAARWGKNSALPFLTSGELHVRQYVWLPSTTEVTDQLSILVTGNMVDPFPSSNILLRPGQVHAVTDGTVREAVFEFPRDRWVCVELHLVIGNANGAIAVAIDGTTLISATGIDTQVAGGYSNLDAGVHYATPDQRASQMWIDEVVADTSPIGCN